ncbi:hypothetical protein FQN57_001439 [Myotisia sp. PD_48]|nr:hypothetical protein FQN57_001439 [Myotisia sp. PD_48]
MSLPEKDSDLLVVQPSGPNHTHTLVLLHGMGSNAELFGIELLESTKIPARLPSVRFVFPTAPMRRATRFKRLHIHQWFDCYSIDDPNERSDLQIEGLCETASSLRNLIDDEAKLLGDGGYQNIVLGGLSQGCAASAFTLLGGGFGSDGNQKLGGYIGLSGWLPFERQLNDLSKPNALDNGDDPFSSSERTDDAVGLFDALNHIRDILDLPLLTPEQSGSSNLEPILPSSAPPEKYSTPDYLRSPAFIAHGAKDEKVIIHLGEKLTKFLCSTMQMDVTWKAYEDLDRRYVTILEGKGWNCGCSKTSLGIGLRRHIL